MILNKVWYFALFRSGFNSYARSSRLRLKCDGTRAETRFGLSAKRTSPFKLAGASVQSTTGSRGVRISGNNAGYTVFRGSVRVLATHSIRQFPLHFPTFPSRASPCAIRFQLDSSNIPLHSLHYIWISHIKRFTKTTFVYILTKLV
jgi:hypothetical protein